MMWQNICLYICKNDRKSKRLLAFRILNRQPLLIVARTCRKTNSLPPYVPMRAPACVVYIVCVCLSPGSELFNSFSDFRKIAARRAERDHIDKVQGRCHRATRGRHSFHHTQQFMQNDVRNQKPGNGHHTAQRTQSNAHARAS